MAVTAELWRPGSPLLSSDEAAALEDITTPPPTPNLDPWETP